MPGRRPPPPTCGTALLAALCVGVHVVSVVSTAVSSSPAGSSRLLDAGSLYPLLVLPPRWQVWRLLSSAFLHAGFLHLLFNTLSLMSLGPPVERALGTVQFLAATLVLVLVAGLLYVTLCAGLAKLTGSDFWYTYACVGFSGALFGMAAIESFLPSATPTRSFFGLCKVPTKAHPWILMACLQFLMPNVSLLGHLTGLVSGCLWALGAFRRCMAPAASVRRWEQDGGCLAATVRRASNNSVSVVYVPCPDTTENGGRGLTEVMGVVSEGCHVVRTWCGRCLFGSRRAGGGDAGSSSSSSSSSSDNGAAASAPAGGSPSASYAWPEGGHTLGRISTANTARAVDDAHGIVLDVENQAEEPEEDDDDDEPGDNVPLL